MIKLILLQELSAVMDVRINEEKCDFRSVSYSWLESYKRSGRSMLDFYVHMEQ